MLFSVLLLQNKDTYYSIKGKIETGNFSFSVKYEAETDFFTIFFHRKHTAETHKKTYSINIGN